ncbi:MAG: GAF domain-containing protein [Desulfobacteraceae bacterium]|nr:GAF domain-containing protein [Desulfobacteraceae bacterium]
MGEENKISIEIFKIVKRAMGQSSGLDDMANNLVQFLTAALEIKGVTLFVSNPEEMELEIMTSFGLSDEYLLKGAISSKKSIVNLYKHKPVLVKNTSDTDMLQYPEAAVKEGIQSIISLPVVFSGKVIGALRLYCKEVWDISDHDLESLMLFADQVGMAMMYARLLNAFETIRQTVMNVHGVWVE